MKLLKYSCAAAWIGATMLFSACGGGGTSAVAPNPTPAPIPSFSVGGNIWRLGSASGLTLVNGSETLHIPADTSTFTFTNKVSQNGTYNVTIGQQPAGAVCAVSGATGSVVEPKNVESILVWCVPPQDSDGYSVSTFAGDDGKTFVDGVGSDARFGDPEVIVTDSVGNFYVSDLGSNSIRRVSPLGTVSTLAIIDGNPVGMAIDTSDNLYVADARNHRVLKIPPTGVVSTLAGSRGERGYVDGPATTARFSAPNGVAVDQAGNVYVSDGWYGASSSYHRIRKITPSGVVSTLAGGTDAGFVDGAGADARFNAPGQMTVDSTGNVYVTDYGNTAIRKITPAGVVSTFVGGPGSRGTENFDGVGSAARFGSITAITFDAAGNLYVADARNCSVRKITPGAVVSTVAGDARYGLGGTQGFVDGTGTAARFSSPTGIVLDATGNLRVVDSGNRAIRTVSLAGVVTTLAGQGPVLAIQNGTGTAARFRVPNSLATDGAGNVYVAERDEEMIRKITPGGVVTTLVDFGQSFRYTTPKQIAADPAGNVYVADSAAIRKISPAGLITTLPPVANSQAIAADASGTLYVASGSSIVKVKPDGEVTTLAGADSAGFADGQGSAARFNAPKGIAVDATGNVYVADTFNHAIRKISPQGQVTTLANNRILNPWAVAVDSEGTVFLIANGYEGFRAFQPDGGAVFKITSSGVVTTLAGSPYTLSGRADGPGATALFNHATSIAVGSAGNLYVADSGNGVIRKVAK